MGLFLPKMTFMPTLPQLLLPNLLLTQAERQASVEASNNKAQNCC